MLKTNKPYFLIVALILTVSATALSLTACGSGESTDSQASTGLPPDSVTGGAITPVGTLSQQEQNFILGTYAATVSQSQVAGNPPIVRALEITLTGPQNASDQYGHFTTVLDGVAISGLSGIFGVTQNTNYYTITTQYLSNVPEIATQRFIIQMTLAFVRYSNGNMVFDASRSSMQFKDCGLSQACTSSLYGTTVTGLSRH